MLVKSKPFDVEPVGAAQEAIDIDAHRVCGEFGNQARTESLKGMCVVGFNVELGRELVVDGLDELAKAIEQRGNGGRELDLLVAPWDRQQADIVRCGEFTGVGLTDVSLVPDDVKVAMPTEQFAAGLQVAHVGRGELKIENQTATRDQQVQFVAVVGQLFGNGLAIGGTVDHPFAATVAGQGAGNKVEVHDRHRETVHDTLAILGDLHRVQHRTAYVIQQVRQLPPPPIEAALRRQMRKHIPVRLHVAQ